MPDKINIFNNAASLNVAPAFAPFTGVRLWIDSNNYVFAGDETGRVLEEDCPWATKEMAENTLKFVRGYVYQPFEAGGALVDPAAELGDGITVGGIYGPLSTMDTVFDAACASDVSAPSEEGAEIEYRVVPRKDRANDRKFAENRSLITKTAEEIRLEVESNQTNTNIALEELEKSFEEDLAHLSGTFTETLKQYATITLTNQKFETAVSTSKQYTDTETGKVVASLDKYSTITQTDSKLEASVNTSKQYTDTQITNLSNSVNGNLAALENSFNVTLEKYATITLTDSKFSTAVSESKTYTDTKTGEVVNSLSKYSTIEQTADSIELAVTGLINETQANSLISQAVDKIELSVSNGKSSSTIKLMSDGTEISSQTIRFTGDVVFESDLAAGNTVVSGDCITTGTILAERLQLGGEMWIYDSLDSNADEAGYFGYLEGKIFGSSFVGCGIISMYDTAVLASEDDDVLIAAYDDIGLYSDSGKVLIGSEYLIPTNDEHTYCGSYSYWWYDGYFANLHVEGEAITTSDIRQKENVSYDLSKYIAVFDQLKPCSYKFIKGHRTHLGMIAQEVEAAADNVGIDLEHFAAVCIDRENDVYGLRYAEFIPLLIAKVKQLEAEIKELKIA